jgi:hypothetical protein
MGIGDKERLLRQAGRLDERRGKLYPAGHWDESVRLARRAG